MASPFVTMGTAANFEQAVLAQSREQPVLVDFWAAWCAPCRALAPVIDELASKLDGALRVVKVDTDAEPALAGSYGIRSLPTLLLFRDGQAVKQVVGAQPLAALERLVSPYLARATDPALAAAHAAYAAGDDATAIAELERARAQDASDYRIHPVLATLYLGQNRINEARALLAELPPNLAVDDEVAPVRARLSLADAAEAEAAGDEVSREYRTAVDAAVRGDFDMAVALLLDLLSRHREWQNGAIRKTLLDIFNVVGNEPRVKTWRTQMARTLN